MASLGSYIDSHKYYFCTSALRRYYSFNRAVLPLHEYITISLSDNKEKTSESNNSSKTTNHSVEKNSNKITRSNTPGFSIQNVSLGLLHNSPLSVSDKNDNFDYFSLIRLCFIYVFIYRPIILHPDPFMALELKYRLDPKFLLSLIEEFWLAPIQCLLRNYEKKSYLGEVNDLRSFVSIIVVTNAKNDFSLRMVNTNVYKTQLSGLYLNQLTEQLVNNPSLFFLHYFTVVQLLR